MHGTLAIIPIVVGPLAAIAAYTLGAQTEFLWLLAVVVFYQIWNLILLLFVDFTTSGILRSRAGFQRPSEFPVKWSVLLLAIVATQLIHPLCCCLAQWTTQVSCAA